jgi:hypothetical protein
VCLMPVQGHELFFCTVLGFLRSRPRTCLVAVIEGGVIGRLLRSCPRAHVYVYTSVHMCIHAYKRGRRETKTPPPPVSHIPTCGCAPHIYAMHIHVYTRMRVRACRLVSMRVHIYLHVYTHVCVCACADVCACLVRFRF